MSDFGGNVWVVIEMTWQKKMFEEEVKKRKKKHGPGADLTNWLWQKKLIC